MLELVLAIATTFANSMDSATPRGWSRLAQATPTTEWSSDIDYWMQRYKGHGYIIRPVGTVPNGPIYLGGACIQFAPNVSPHFRWKAPDASLQVPAVEGHTGLPMPNKVEWWEYYKCCSWHPSYVTPREQVNYSPVFVAPTLQWGRPQFSVDGLYYQPGFSAYGVEWNVEPVVAKE